MTEATPYKIYQGSQPKPPFIVKLLQSDQPGADPVDLTGVDEIVVCFPNEDGSDTELKLSDAEIEIVGNPILGKINILYTAAQSALFKTSESSTLEVAVTDDGETDPWKVQIPHAYSVLASLC